MPVLIEEIVLEANPADIVSIFQDKPYPVLLDSSLAGQNLGRYSIIAFNPFLLFRATGKQIELIRNGETTTLEQDPFECLQELLRKYQTSSSMDELPFVGGCIGYFSYDLYSLIERVPAQPATVDGIPDLMLGFYHTAVIVDHHQKKIAIVVNSVGFSQEDNPEVSMAQIAASIIKEIYKWYEKKMQAAKEGAFFAEQEKFPQEIATCPKEITTCPKEITTCPKEMQISPGQKGITEYQLQSNFTKESYCRMITKAKQYIQAGDIYQVNLSQRFQTKVVRCPLELYQQLRTISPAPFAAYVDFGELKILCNSPERFIKVQDNQIETRPIKGTRSRGTTPEQDEQLKADLLSSAKDQAELIMIIDLERNDLGRICQMGSVEVTKLIEMEEYATVFHLVSTIKGILRDDVEVQDILRATFPGGSITGAPKIRAMEIIAELEPTRRQIYTGAIGYIGFNGDLDLNIAIRTIVIKGKEASFQVGGGIVWDSVPENEYQETLDKGKALIEVLSR